MEKRQSNAYVLVVRRQNFVPTYFTQCDTQLSEDNEDFKNPSASDAEINKHECVHSSWHTSQRSALRRSDSEPAIRTTPSSIRRVNTTLTLSSARAKHFACNINKMSFGIQRNCVCDGFYGCPEEETAKKAGSLKKGKPVCRVPWKRRTNGVPSKSNKKKAAQAQSKSVVSNDYYVSKVDVKVDTTTKRDGHVTSLAPPLANAVSCASRSARGLKSHPGMFYSYGVVSGFHYRTACLPKRRSCDGYFGCCDEHKSSITGKPAQGRKERGTSNSKTIKRTLKKN